MAQIVANCPVWSAYFRGWPESLEGVISCVVRVGGTSNKVN
jgi:hypothetical protein